MNFVGAIEPKADKGPGDLGRIGSSEVLRVHDGSVEGG